VKETIQAVPGEEDVIGSPVNNNNNNNNNNNSDKF
jgi:hypothetical protein